MEIVIADYSLEPIFSIENAKVLWCEKYQACGDFELFFTDYDDTIVPQLKTEYYVMKEDTEEVGIIEDITVQKTYDEGTTVKVTGRMVTCLLERRVILETVNLKGNIEDMIYKLIDENIINPDLSDRHIDNFELAEQKGFKTKIQKQITGKDLLTAITDICVAYDYGFHVVVRDHNFVFEVYKGKDRTYNQIDNVWMIFSEEFENLNSSELQVNVTTNKTFCVVAGEGSGADRKKIELDSGATGIDRKELYVDARDLQSNSGDEKVLTPEEYQEALINRGVEKLQALATSVRFEGDVDITSYKYKEDFSLGDLVIVENESWNMTMYPKIIEVLECYDENGYSVSLTYAQ